MGKKGDITSWKFAMGTLIILGAAAISIMYKALSSGEMPLIAVTFTWLLIAGYITYTAMIVKALRGEKNAFSFRR